MMALPWLFDGLLMITLLALALRVLLISDLYQAVVLFIAFGLLMALAWVRLQAPDIALAEAAIGAGLTGVLLLDAVRQMQERPDLSGPQSGVAGDPDSRPQPATASARGRSANLRRIVVLALAGVLLCLFGAAVLDLPREAAGLTALVHAHLAESGVEHGVTAVLLNFRGYDTWLELAVLVLALVGCLGVLQQRDLSAAQPVRQPGELLATLVRTLAPVMILVAGYLLWLGKAAAGGAFQAGVVLAATWVLMWFGGRRGIAAAPMWLWRGLVVAGVAGFLVAAVATLIWQGTLLRFPPHAAGTIILALEVLASLSIGVILAALIIAPQSGTSRAPAH
jgi:multisubunit Na+/H+ antiporter MnhB subunit